MATARQIAASSERLPVITRGACSLACDGAHLHDPPSAAALVFESSPRTASPVGAAQASGAVHLDITRARRLPTFTSFAAVDPSPTGSPKPAERTLRYRSLFHIKATTLNLRRLHVRTLESARSATFCRRFMLARHAARC